MSVGSKSSSNLSIKRYLVTPLDEEPTSAAAIKAALAQEAGVQPHPHCENALNKLPQAPDDSCSSVLAENSRPLSDDGLISKRRVSAISSKHSSASGGSASSYGSSTSSFSRARRRGQKPSIMLSTKNRVVGNRVVGQPDFGRHMPRMQLPKRLKGSTRRKGMRMIKGAMSLSFALFAKKLLRQSMSGSVMRELCTCHRKHGYVVIRRDQLLLGAHFAGNSCPRKNI